MMLKVRKGRDKRGSQGVVKVLRGLLARELDDCDVDGTRAQAVYIQ